MRPNSDRAICWRCGKPVEPGQGFNMRVREFDCARGSYRGGGWATTHCGQFQGLRFKCIPEKAPKQ